jgi:hypothetical protein
VCLICCREGNTDHGIRNDVYNLTVLTLINNIIIFRLYIQHCRPWNNPLYNASPPQKFQDHPISVGLFILLNELTKLSLQHKCKYVNLKTKATISAIYLYISGYSPWEILLGIQEWHVIQRGLSRWRKQGLPMPSFISQFYRLDIPFKGEVCDWLWWDEMKFFSPNDSFIRFSSFSGRRIEFHPHEFLHSLFTMSMACHQNCWCAASLIVNETLRALPMVH